MVLVRPDLQMILRLFVCIPGALKMHGIHSVNNVLDQMPGFLSFKTTLTLL